MSGSKAAGVEMVDDRHPTDTAPGDRRSGGSGESGPGEGSSGEGIGTYLAGFALAVLLTGVSFLIARTSLVWQPSIPIALFVLAVAQMGVHLVFFLHITTGPDGTNTVMALAFGVLIVILLVGGSVWIMSHLNHSMMPMDRIMQMQR